MSGAGMIHIPMRVGRPDQPPKKVETIACTEDHLGNLIAEGHMDAADYYKMLAEDYKRRFNRAVRQHYEESKKREQRAYALNWVEHYMEGLEQLAVGVK